MKYVDWGGIARRGSRANILRLEPRMSVGWGMISVSHSKCLEHSLPCFRKIPTLCEGATIFAKSPFLPASLKVTPVYALVSVLEQVASSLLLRRKTLSKVVKIAFASRYSLSCGALRRSPV